MNHGRRDVTVKRTDTGLGLFTLLPVSAGKRIIEYTGRLISGAEANSQGGRYLFGFGKGLTIDGTERSNKARYINHSCNPNAEALYSGRRLWIYAKRALTSGEAITIDYGTEYFDVFIKPKGCRCEMCGA
jgi:SET domain-containing protein